jgi:hypothetical protein
MWIILTTSNRITWENTQDVHQHIYLLAKILPVRHSKLMAIYILNIQQTSRFPRRFRPCSDYQTGVGLIQDSVGEQAALYSFSSNAISVGFLEEPPATYANGHNRRDSNMLSTSE